MANTPKKKAFQVVVDLQGSFSITLTANTLEEALQYARSYKSRELIDSAEQWNDHETQISGVFE
jgi:hypothetical protein